MPPPLSSLFLFVAASALAGESFWTNENGGDFWGPANWSHGVPGIADTAQFTNRSISTVHFSNSATNSAASFHRGVVTQDIAGASWFLTNSLRVGQSAGETGRVVLASGSLIVTNSGRNATIQAGGAGTGEFTIAGAQVTVDSLVATNRDRSILRFKHGNLTLLNGGILDPGSRLFDGGTPGNLFTWNLLGGTTRVVSDPLVYGALTLGSSSPELNPRSPVILNLAGTNTVLDVVSIDVTESTPTFGGHNINITAGSRLLTLRVQLGLGTGSVSNSVLIAGPGSAWINHQGMWFGMHAGSQTLVITNGGFMQTAQFDFMHRTGNRMLIAGDNATFQCYGTMNLGFIFCSSPGCPTLDNTIVIGPGGVLSAYQLTYGTPFAMLGNLILVDGGSLQIAQLDFTTGALRVDSGTARINTLNLKGGDKSVLQVSAALLFGHAGDLSSGQLRVGDTNVSATDLNGTVIAPDIEIGMTPGSVASLTMTGGTMNASSALTLGRAGTGDLQVTGGLVTSPSIRVGAQPGGIGILTISGTAGEVRVQELHVGRGGTQGLGTVLVTDGGTLEAEVYDAHPSRPIIISGAVQFSTHTPSIPVNSVIVSNGVISFRNMAYAPVTLEPGGILSPISRLGSTSLRLLNSTNAPVTSLTFGPGEQVYDKVILANGENRLQANWLQVSPGSQVLVTNSHSRISGTVTNAGEIHVVDGTLVFEGPVYFKPGASITGTSGRVIFDSAVYLPSGDIPVSPGISLQFETLASEGGRMRLAGSTLELHSANVPWPAGLVTISNGIVTYVNTPDVPLGLPTGIDFLGDVGLRFINSSNAFVDTHTFEAGPDRYSRLYLPDDEARWQSRTLAIGQGGSLIITNSRPTVALEDRFFSIHSGGTFTDYTTNSFVGFSPDASAHTTLVTDPGSVWTTPGDLRIGDSGSANHLIVSNRASVFSGVGYLGVNPGSDGNKVTLRGSNSLWHATNGVRLGFRGGKSNVLEIVERATMFSAGTLSLSGGPDSKYNSVIVSGAGSTATFTGVGLGDASGLIVTTGGVLRSTGMFLSAQRVQASNSVLVAGPGALIVNSGNLLLGGTGTRLEVKRGGIFSAVNINAFPFSGLIEVTDAGSLFDVKQNFLLTGGTHLRVGTGATLTAPSLDLNGLPDTLRLTTSGRVVATNLARTGLLKVRGTAEIVAGQLAADLIVATNGTNSRLFFHAGIVEALSADLNTGAPFFIGSGSAIARWHMTGASNYFRQGVTIQPLGELTGLRLVVGNVTNRGAIARRPSLSTLAINGALQFADTGTLAYSINTTPSPTTPALLVNPGPLHFDGTLHVTIVPPYVPNPTNIYNIVRYSAASGGFQNITAGRVLTADNLGSFAVQSSATELHLTDYRTEDADGDGIQDSWAVRFFGDTPLPAGSGVGARDGDDDGDGLSNIREFLLGTDPHDSQSALRLEISRHPSGGVALRFPYLAGWNYQINYSSNLKTWIVVSNPSLNIGATGTAEWIDAPPPSARFYRLLLRN